MKAKEFIPVSKPRNFVAKNQKTAGAGAHKDKKRAEKQGDVKHKKQSVPMEADRGFRGIGGARGRENDENDKIDAQIRADYEKKKQYEVSGKFWLKQKDTQQHISDEFVGKAAANKAALELLKQKPELKGNLLITAYGPDEKREGVAEVSKATIDRYVAKASDAHGDADFKARMSKNDPDKRSYHVDQKKTAEKRRQGISRALDRMSREESVGEATSVAVRMQRAADKQRAKSDASLARTPSSIPKKEEPKKS